MTMVELLRIRVKKAILPLLYLWLCVYNGRLPVQNAMGKVVHDRRAI